MMDESDNTVQSGEFGNSAQMENDIWKKVGKRLLLYFELLIALLTPAFVMSVIIIAVGKSLEYSNQSIKFEESDPNALITLNYAILLIVSSILTYCAFVVFYFLVREEARKRGNKLVKTFTDTIERKAKKVILPNKNVEQSRSDQNDNN